MKHEAVFVCFKHSCWYFHYFLSSFSVNRVSNHFLSTLVMLLTALCSSLACSFPECSAFDLSILEITLIIVIVLPSALVLLNPFKVAEKQSCTKYGNCGRASWSDLHSLLVSLNTIFFHCCGALSWHFNWPLIVPRHLFCPKCYWVARFHQSRIAYPLVCITSHVSTLNFIVFYSHSLYY